MQHFPLRLALLPITLLALASCNNGSVNETSTEESTPVEPPASTESPTDSAKRENVDAAAAAELLKSGKELVIIDLRTPAEHQSGHLEGAVLIDFTGPDFESKVSELDRETTYLVHCQSGGRSTQSLPTFEKLEFQHIVHLDGGFLAWSEGGHPVVKP